jgi:hypothetical protein
VLFAGAGLAAIGLGALVFVLLRGDRDAEHVAAPGDALASIVGDASNAEPSVVDAALVASGPPRDASIAQDAAAPRDASVATSRDAAMTRDAGSVATVRDAATIDAASVATIRDAGEPEDAGDPDEATKLEAKIQKTLKFLATSDTDFEASREFMLLELAAPKDPRLTRARDDARKVIIANAHDDDTKTIHLALVNHEWAKGLAKCREQGKEPRIDMVVQCTVFACILDDAEMLEPWANKVGYRPMLEAIEQYCQRFHK